MKLYVTGSTNTGYGTLEVLVSNGMYMFESLNLFGWFINVIQNKVASLELGREAKIGSG